MNNINDIHYSLNTSFNHYISVFYAYDIRVLTNANNEFNPLIISTHPLKYFTSYEPDMRYKISFILYICKIFSTTKHASKDS